MICSNCNTENPPDARQCAHCGSALTTPTAPAHTLPPLPQLPETQGASAPGYPMQTPPAVPSPPPMAAPPPNYAGQTPPNYSGYYGPPQGAYPPYPVDPATSVINTIIPTNNPKALVGYYVAIFSFIPLLGIFLGIGGFVLGLQGLHAVKQNPAIKGKAHAWVAIIVGGLFGFGYLILTIVLIVAAILSARR